MVTEAEDKSSEGKHPFFLNEIHFSGDDVLLENSNQAPAFRLPISASPCLHPKPLAHCALLTLGTGAWQYRLELSSRER